MSSLQSSSVHPVASAMSESVPPHNIRSSSHWGRATSTVMSVRSLLIMSAYMILNMLTLGKLLLPEQVAGYLHLPPFKTFMYTPVNPFLTNQNGQDVTFRLRATKWWYDLGTANTFVKLLARRVLTCMTVVNQLLTVAISWISYIGNKVPTIKSVWVDNHHLLIRLFICYHLCLVWWCYYCIYLWLYSTMLTTSIIGMLISSLFGSNSKPYPTGRKHKIRAKFRNLAFTRTSEDMGVNHGHQEEARLRTSADDTINEFITESKSDIYSIQKSSKDINSKIPGSLDLRMLIDAHHGVVGTDEVSKNAMFKLINVDYYINWLDYLWMDRPFIMYTATPKTLTGVAGAMRWTITPENKLRMQFDGGASYEHEVWDYSVDNIQVEYPGLAIAYHVDTMRVDDNWSIVLLTPYHRSYSPTLIPHCSLKRKQYVHSVKTLHTVKLDKTILNSNHRINVALQYTNSSSGALQIARPNDYVTVSVEPKIAAYIRAAASARGGLEEHSVFTGIVNSYPTDARNSATSIYMYFPLLDVDIQTNLSAYRLKDEDVNYNMPTDERDGPNPPCKNVATVIGPTVILGGVAACESKANDNAAVRKRIQDTSNANKPLPENWIKYLDEFNSMLFKEKMAPATMDEVRAMIKTSTKMEKFDKALPVRADFMEQMESEVQQTISSFQKKETYNEPKDPRNISSLPTEHYATLSQYTLPIAKFLKQNARWYAFGKHPDEVAKRMHEVCSKAKSVAETDFSRFDGTHTFAMYEMEERMMRHCYPTEFYDEIKKVYTILKTSRARTKDGVKYDLLGTRASGGADTSLGNSYINAGFNYVVFRLKGETPEQAMEHLGVYGGDDGVTPDPYSEAEQLAADANLRLKMTIKKPGDIVTMLARLYPDIWTRPNHCCDPARNIPRLHVSVKGSETTNTAELINRATGYLVTDPFTAIISNWSNAVLRVYEGKGEVTTYSAMQYENQHTYCLSMEDTVTIVAEHCAVSVDRVRDYCNKINDIKTVDEFNRLEPLIPLDLSDEKRTGAKVNIGDILHPVDEKMRAHKVAPVPLSEFKIPKGFEKCVPSPLDRDPVNRFFRAASKHRPKRFIDLTAGVGFDSAFASEVFKCPKIAYENNVERFEALKQNLRNHKGVVLKLADSASIPFISGDLVMLDPLWPPGKAILRFNNMPIETYIKTKLLPAGVSVMLRTPVNYTFDWKVTPVLIRRIGKDGKKKPEYKLFHIKSGITKTA